MYAVSPHGGDIEGIGCVRSVAELPEGARPGSGDGALAVKVVPVARRCGDRGVRSLVVITTSLTAAQESGLLEATRRSGMRLAGPASCGVAVPGIGLAATTAARHPVPGRTGVIAQSGGVGMALLEHLSRLGIGISSFAWLGGMLHVSSTGMLLWRQVDGTTDLAVLYVDSFGDPRRFLGELRAGSARESHRDLVHTPVAARVSAGLGPGHRGGRRAADHPQALFEQVVLSPPTASATC